MLLVSPPAHGDIFVKDTLPIACFTGSLDLPYSQLTTKELGLWASCLPCLCGGVEGSCELGVPVCPEGEGPVQSTPQHSGSTVSEEGESNLQCSWSTVSEEGEQSPVLTEHCL